jgi:hypothetical protein
MLHLKVCANTKLLFLTKYGGNVVCQVFNQQLKKLTL